MMFDEMFDGGGSLDINYSLKKDISNLKKEVSTLKALVYKILNMNALEFELKKDQIKKEIK